MRNLKKVLSLALCLVMLLGMMVVGAGATSFKDDNDIKNKEAVDVMTAIGVFKGVGDGSSFNPTGKMDRAQAAVVIAKLDLGNAADNLAVTGAATFEDVAADHYAKAYIDYCVGRGLIQGDGKGHFFPTQEVSSVEFCLMVLHLLGYNDGNESIGGENWRIQAATLARKAGLTTIVNAGTAAMTRDDMAQVAFNALTADMVGYTQPPISYGELTIPGSASAPITHKAGDDLYTSATPGTAAGTESVKLCEEKFPALKLNASDTDSFLRDASTWSYDGTPVYTKANAANLTYTNETSKAVIGKALKDLGVTFTGTSVISVKNGILNGAPANPTGTADITGSTQDAVATAIAGKTDPGVKVEIFIDSTSKKVDGVVITEYTVEELQSITEKKDAMAYKFSVSGTKTNDEDNTRVIFEGAVEKGDVVTTATDKDGALHVYPTTSFDANQTAKKTVSGVTTLTIGGETYTLATGVKKAAATPIAAADFANNKDDATYFVDVNGYIVAKKGAVAAPAEYAVLVNSVASKSADLDSVGFNVSVRAILADGTVADFPLALSVGDGTNGTTNGTLYSGKVALAANAKTDPSLDTTVLTALTGANDGTGVALWSYTMDGDKMVLGVPGEGMRTAGDAVTGKTYGAKLAAYKGTTVKKAQIDTDLDVLFSGDTTFVLYNKDGSGKWQASTVKGTADLNLPTAGLPGLAVVKASGTTTAAASLVFLQGEAGVADTGNYVYVDASKPTSVLKDSKDVWQYTGIAPDGTEVEVFTGDGKDATKLAKNGVYGYDENGKILDPTHGKVLTTTDETASNTDPVQFSRLQSAEVSGKLLKLANTYVNITDDTEIRYTADGLEGVHGNQCFVVMDVVNGAVSKNVATIYVYGTQPTLTLDKTSLVLDSGTANLQATFNAGTSGLTVSSWAWDNGGSGNDTKATVAADASDNSKATVTYVGDGDVTITVTATLSDSSNLTATCAVTNKDVAAVIGSIVYEDTVGETINVEGAETTNKTPAKGASVTITLADQTVTADEIVVVNANTSDFTVAKEILTAGDGTKSAKLTITAVATTGSTNKTFTVKVTAKNTAEYKDTEVSTITVKIANQAT